MVYVVFYTNRYGHPAFMANYFNGMARHTAKCDAEHTIRKSAGEYTDAKVMKFKTMAQAGEWLSEKREAARQAAYNNQTGLRPQMDAK